MRELDYSSNVTVTVHDGQGTPQAGVVVRAFNDDTNTNISAVTDENGQASLLLPEGSYRFEADRNGYRYFSGESNDCTVLGCDSSSITVPVFSNVTVTVQDSNNTPQEGLSVYTLDGDTQIGYAAASDAKGQATFSLPAGEYRFRADLHGFQYFSSPTNNCTIPNCNSAGITTPVFGKVTVTDRSSEYAPQADLPVYAYSYDDNAYTGVSGITDSDGYVDFWLPTGDYRFRSDQFNFTYWSGAENDCTVPDCTNASVVTIGTVNAMTGQTIHYTYDPLDRLTAADYTDGRYFHYNYDPVGNRLSEDSKNGPDVDAVTNNYTYDSANRLTGVNGARYSWDNNGNMLSDGKFCRCCLESQERTC